jgi:carbon-monoxide dehydrogenase catalytic subunit
VIYEKAVYEIALRLIQNDVLVLTNGCASFPLLKLGLCSRKSRESGPGLRSFLRGELPPVWHMGECLDNARATALFKGLADAARLPMKDMPFAFASPEWSNEKGLAAAAAFRLSGINSYHCVHAPVQASARVRRFLQEDTLATLGSVMVTEVNPLALADKILEHLADKRKNLPAG